MSVFTGSLVIEEVTPGRRWRLREPIRYEAVAKGSGLVIEVPAGFETDGATIPAPLRLVLAVWGTYGRAACVHDFLYSLIRAGLHEEHPAFAGLVTLSHDEPLSYVADARKWADREFLTAMRACGTRPTLAWLIWTAVRLFGGFYLRRPKGRQVAAFAR